MRKYSKQRELVLNSLRSRYDHPTAEMLYNDLRKDLPTIGIATIYRNLTSLCDDGIINKIKVDDGPDRFDAEMKTHIHFYCANCKKLHDIFIDEDKSNKIKNELYKETIDINCYPENFSIVIYGKCDACKKASEI